MDLGITPFNVQLPPGYTLAPPVTTLPTPSPTSAPGTSAPVDVVSISNQVNAGTIDVASGDVYSLADLLTVDAATGQTVNTYRVALGGQGNGRLLLNGVDVTAKTSFTTDQFAKLTYVAGDQGTAQNLTILAQSGKVAANGTLTNVTDSQAVQLTASVTGTRSLAAIGALLSTPADADASTVAVVKEANILAGATGIRPTVATIGNFTALAGESYRVSSVFTADTATGTIQTYHVAMDGQGDGQLLLNGLDVSNRNSFTADEYNDLIYVTGSDGTQQNLTVVAQSGVRKADGTVSDRTDSQAVRLTASVTGSRSFNALAALASPPADGDAAAAAIVREANIFTGIGNGRPSVNTVGNFTATADDTFSLAGLVSASSPTASPIAAYRVALSGAGDGKLMLNGVDVSSRTSFTAAEYAQLSYVAGSTGSTQNLTVAAQTGTIGKNGALTNIIDSTPIQISAAVTGHRSINALGGLTSTTADADANVAAIVKESNIFAGVGSGRPTVTTAGNFTAVDGDAYSFASLFQASASPTANANGQASQITGYRIALSGAGDGRLLLNGADVSNRTSFTAAEFAQLTYVAGANGTAQNLTVVAQSGTTKSDGSIANRVDSAAIQINASVTGTRSLNALLALRNAPQDADAKAAAVAREANILAGTGNGTPSLATIGNLTGNAGDVFSLSSLFKATASNSGSVSTYRIGLSGGGSGRLMLNGTDVSDRTSFTAAEFASLTYEMGQNGTAQSLTVAAQAASRSAGSSLTSYVDSAPIQISLATTGTRSLNALAALTAAPADADANTANLVRQANVLTGIGAGRPVIQTSIAAAPALSLAALATAIGSFQTSAMPSAGTAFDLASQYADAIGNDATTGTFAAPSTSLTAALLMLGGGAIGAYQTAARSANQSTAIQAYNRPTGT